MKKIICLSVTFTLFFFSSYPQTKKELKTKQAEKQAEADKYIAEVNNLQVQIDALPGWHFGAFGTIGGSLSNFSNWYAQGTPNNSSGSIGFTANAHANLIEDTFFWRNALNVNLNWVKLDDKDMSTDSENFNPTTDVFNLSSHYGKRLSKKWAVSGLTEYRTTLLNNFNNPGYLDLGVGATWTPLRDLIIAIHPLNYNFVFRNSNTIFQSSLGAKIVLDYTRQFGAFNLKSNFSTFQNYSSADLSNWTWNNSFGYTLWKIIGIGFDFALRNNKQEAANFQNVALENADNKLQSYYTIGLSYKF